MAGNTFGNLFRLTTFGESHGMAIGAVIDGCPAGLTLEPEDIQKELDRRKPGQSSIVSPRLEEDEVQILSGVFKGLTTGAPIALLLRNKDMRPGDYEHLSHVYRPSHADYTWEKKYGHRDYRGGGRSSARETACRVAAGAIAKKYLMTYGISVRAYVSQVGTIALETPDESLNLDLVESNPVRCPEPEIARKMEELIEQVKEAGDTIGGIVSCLINGCPPGLGEPVFDKLHADLGKAVLSINACKGFEIGSGFSSAFMRGSRHNDPFIYKEKVIQTQSNNSGGVQGGISNGMPVYFKAAFKPVSTIMQLREGIDQQGKPVKLPAKGRHDPCIVPRAVPVVESMAALVLADHMLRHKSDKL